MPQHHSPRHSRLLLAASTLAAAMVGCSAPGSTPPSSGGPGTTSGTSSGGPATNPDGPVALPFAVSQEFVPSGFMGDSPTDFDGIKMSSESSQCIARQPGAVGSCYFITWTPTLLTGAKSAWVGVYWQYPSNNWGGKAGKPIAPGATKVTFSAAGAAGGEQVEFLVGGVNTMGGMASLTNADSFTASTQATLTTAWATYEIALTGKTYSDVIGGFAWSITTSAATPVAFYIDDIQWE